MYTRRIELRCTAADLATYGAVVLYDGEVIYVQQSDGRYAVKIGDGVTALSDLAYVVNYADIQAAQDAAELARDHAEAAQGAAESALAGANAAVASLDVGLSVQDGKLCITYDTNSES